MSERAPMMLLGKIALLACSAQARALCQRPDAESIDPSRVEWIETEGSHSRLFAAGGSRLVHGSLRELERDWLAAGFLRISSRVMVNVRRIRSLRSWHHRRCEVLMESGMSWPCEYPFLLPLGQCLSGRSPAGSAGRESEPGICIPAGI